MININFEGTIYPIKNQTNELLIGEFEDLCAILNDEDETKINKWSEVFKYLGVPEHVVDEMDSFAFIDIIKEFKIFDEELSKDFIKEIEIDGKIYSSFDESFKITVKENGIIEQAVQKNDKKYIGEMMAVLFKLEGTDKTIWYDAAHLKHKSQLFRTTVTVDKAIPFINYLTKKLVKETQLIENDAKV
jgi:hypothetical protein